MKKEYWQNELETLLCWPFFASLSSVGTIVSAILTIKNTFIWPLLVSFGGITLLSLYAILGKKSTLTKVVFSEQEIILKRFKRILTTMKWSEISNIEASYYGKATCYMNFISINSKISFVPTKKMYKTIIALCPYQRLIDQIESIPAFEWFRRKR